VRNGNAALITNDSSSDLSTAPFEVAWPRGDTARVGGGLHWGSAGIPCGGSPSEASSTNNRDRRPTFEYFDGAENGGGGPASRADYLTQAADGRRQTPGSGVVPQLRPSWSALLRHGGESGPHFAVNPRAVVLTDGAAQYGGSTHSVLRSSHPHLAVRNAALRGAAFSVPGLRRRSCPRKLPASVSSRAAVGEADRTPAT
jgi:hypothetical protein